MPNTAIDHKCYDLDKPKFLGGYDHDEEAYDYLDAQAEITNATITRMEKARDMIAGIRVARENLVSLLKEERRENSRDIFELIEIIDNMAKADHLDDMSESKIIELGG